MQIHIPSITRPIHLSDYDPSVTNGASQAVMHVWVNPPRALLDEYREYLALSKALQQQAESTPETEKEKLQEIIEQMIHTSNFFSEFYARLWSQHDDPHTHFAPDEVRRLGDHPTDPQLYTWLTRRTWELIAEYRDATQKK